MVDAPERGALLPHRVGHQPVGGIRHAGRLLRERSVGVEQRKLQRPDDPGEGPVTTVGAPNAPTAFTQNAVGSVGTPSGSLTLFRETITAAHKTSSRTIDLELQLDLTGQRTTPARTPERSRRPPAA